ncbi:MAG: cell division protein FtsW [Candidatus Yanofskybacteria bacterium RIFCSPLOWO2_01_FULL_44_22]|uniref:Probable peptidoglycan glycosyltransferase FtsW n=1 Tax=Candidatus Yanofskybacteria bacterium RIFCSPLOWO2_01_FULL_44_22 TaxID=1802697 RepID=A0A1F8GLQ8_9BACT|nr:MAG: cell division protein FtsW [Candidatus Yanofskybacteria bacterium RIFCSPLOWO2_01_FULL_44_22]
MGRGNKYLFKPEGLSKPEWPDLWLLGISFTLVAFGILVLASVSSSFSLERTGTTFYFLNHQLLFGLLPGLFLGFLAYLLPLEKLKQLSLPFLLFTAVLLLLVFLPFIGGEVKGAYRWIFLGSFSFQPSELLKLTSILYLAALLAAKGEKKKVRQTLLPFLVILGVISILLILQPDISTLGIIGLVGILLYFLSGTPLWHLLLMLGGGVAVLLLLIRLAPYRLSRLAVFFDPMLDPLGKGYQIKQALIGIGSGGLMGVGLGLSFQKFGVLPEPISDSIFAVFAEETGFFGAAFLILLFLLFAWRSFMVAKRIGDPFARLALMGITLWIVLQALVNMGSMTGIFPLAGIPLPFISYGGSALVVELIGLGILLKISRRAS